MENKEIIEKQIKILEDINAKLPMKVMKSEIDQIREDAARLSSVFVVYAEVNKDLRMAEIAKESAERREKKLDPKALEPATLKQQDFMKQLGITFKDTCTKAEAMELIAAKKGKP